MGLTSDQQEMINSFVYLGRLIITDDGVGEIALKGSSQLSLPCCLTQNDDNDDSDTSRIAGYKAIFVNLRHGWQGHNIPALPKGKGAE